MAVTRTDAPFATSLVPPPPGGALRPPKSDASPLSQALAYGAFAVAFAALAVKGGDPTLFVAPVAALALGIAVCLGTDVRRFFRGISGFGAGIAAMIVLSVLWTAAESRDLSFPYALVPLGGLVVVGADWCWVERLRPMTVVSGLGIAFLYDHDIVSALVLALAWFAVAAAALWSLQRDRHRALPTPTPLGGAVPHRVDPSGQELATIAIASVALGIVLTLLISMISLELGSNDRLDVDNASPRPPSGARPGGGSASGSGSGQTGSGQTGGSSGGATTGGGALGGDEDRNGDGVITPADGDGVVVDRDGDGVITSEDGDGVVDDRDGDGVIGADDGVAILDRNRDGVIDHHDGVPPVDRNGDGSIDGDDGYVFLDANDDGVIDRRDTGNIRPNDGLPATDRDGGGDIDRNDVPILSDTNDDGVIDRRDVAITTDLDGSGSIDAGDVERAADRNGDGVVDRRDDLEVVDANDDGAVDDEELLDTLDRNGDGTIDRDEALVLDRDGDGRLDRSETGQLPLSGTLGQQLEERRREMETEDLTRTLLLALAALVAAGAIVLAVVVLRRRARRRRTLIERAWAVVLVERLESEGAQRGRRRRRNEPITHYAAALGDGPLADGRLAEVGMVVSAALFAPVPPDDATGAWAAQVVDEAVAAHPLPTRADLRRERRAARRADEPVTAGAPSGD